MSFSNTTANFVETQAQVQWKDFFFLIYLLDNTHLQRYQDKTN